MHSLNVLIIANENTPVINLILKSKYINKLYMNFEHENGVEIRFNTFKELVLKCKALKIDIVIVDNKKMIFQGIADVLRKNFINCIGLNTFWTQLILSNQFMREMMKKYEFSTPEILRYPSQFPVVVKADGFLKFANSMTELLEIQREISKLSPEISQTMYLEKFIRGEEYTLISFFDGKNVYTLTNDSVNTDVLKDFNSKLETMFNKENSDFIGYINSRVIIENNIIYPVEFNIDFPIIQKDILYILILAIYQKLNELRSF